MAWPDDPRQLPSRLELAFGADPAGDPGIWTWTDVGRALGKQELSLTRGRPDEASEAAPASVAVQLDNPDGDYTPDHAAGANWPHVVQGVPARLSLQAGTTHLRVPDAAGSGARVASSAALNVAGDLDVRVEVALDRLPAQWADPAPTGARPWGHAAQELMGRYNHTAVPTPARMWRFLVGEDGRLVLSWSEDGVTVRERPSSDVVPYVSGQRVTLRATLDVDNGAGGYTLRFYTAATIAGPWVELGQPFTGSSTTSITTTGSADLELADIASIGFPAGAGRYYRAEVRNGIGGTLVAAPDFTGLAPGATSFTDSAGRSWSLAGAAQVTDWRTRLVGTVDDWAPTWPWGDLSNPDDLASQPGEARVDITISGILRRLGQGEDALESTLRRRIPSYDPIAYWPVEDGDGATQAYSPIPGVRPMRISGDVSLGADDSLPGSAALAAVGPDGQLDGDVPPMPSGAWQVEMVYRLDQMPTTLQTLMVVRLLNGVRYVVRIQTNNIQVHTVNDEDVWTERVSITAPSFTGAWSRLQLWVSQNGAAVDLHLGWVQLGGSGFAWEDSFNATAGRVASVGILGVDAGNLRVGHVAVFDSVDVNTFSGADTGFTGETAVTRLRRLAEEEHLPISVLGDAAQATAMGPQRPAALMQLIQECVAADGGILSERREAIGLQYRARHVLYNQPPALVLNARGGDIINPFSPILDDQRFRDDITVSRDSGSSARAVDEELVAQRGRYQDSYTINVAADGQLEPLAWWRLHLASWSGMRYPAVSIPLHGAPDLIDAWMDRAEGDRIQVTNLPPQHPAGTVDLLMEGTNEAISPAEWSPEITCSPGGPWVVGQIAPASAGEETGPVHIDTDGSELLATVDTAATQLIVIARQGPEWVTTSGPTPTAAADDLPVALTVGGEEMTATAIEPMAWDTFARSASGGWGTTPSALVGTPTWLLSGGTAAERSVNGTAGLVTVGDTSAVRFQFLNWSVPDAEMLVAVAVPAVATGASLRAALLMRVSGSDYYLMRVACQTAGTVGIEVVRTTTSLTGVVATGRTYTAGTKLWIRSRVEGQRVRGRTWVDGATEPGGWQVDHTVTSGTIATGPVGVTASRASGNTNTNPQFAFDNFQIVTPQTFTVQRGVNGITKSHASGGDVRLAEPMIFAL